MKAILTFLLLFAFLIGSSTDYYVSDSDGLDADSGLTEALAWKTLSKVSATTFANGDRILFKRGDTFSGTLTVTKSSVSGSAIIYGAYGTGSKPVITSLTTMTGWVLHSTGIYKVVGANIPANCNAVTIDGIYTPMGQYPATGFNNFDSFTGRTSFVDAALTGTPNFTGAEVVIYKSNWTLDRSLVTNHTTSTVTYTSGSSYNPQSSGGYKYFFQKDIDCLLKMGDWYTDGTDFYMYFGANTPSSYLVKAGSSDHTIYQYQKHYNTFRDLVIEGGNLYGLYTAGSVGLSLINCEIKNNGQTGVTIITNGTVGGSTNTLVDSCSFTYTGGTALWINSASSTLKHSTFNYCGKYAGMGAPEGGSHYGTYFKGEGSVCEYNDFLNTGYVPINFYSNSVIIRYNLIDTYPTLGLDDGGGIYTYYGAEDTNQTGIKVYRNIVANSTANGLYPDNLSNNQEWYENIVVNVDKWAIHCNMPQSNNIHDNVAYDFGVAALDIANLSAQTTTASNTTIANNLFIQASELQGIFSLRDSRTNQTLSVPFGTSNNNTYVVDNTATNLFYNSYVLPSFHSDYYSWSAWKTFSGLESTSTYRTEDVSTLEFIYNDTREAKGFPITGVKTNLAGTTTYENSVTLQPYTSLLLLPSDPPPTPTGTRMLKHGGYILTHEGKILLTD